jgi:hypothetical protein
VGVVLADLRQFYFAGKLEPAPGTAPPSPGTPAPLQMVRFSPADDPLRQNIVTDCDRLAAMPDDTGHTPGIAGLDVKKMNTAAATAACNDAMAKYPDVARFVFQAGRAATARKDYAAARRLYDQAAASGYAMAMTISARAMKTARVSP